MSYSLICSTAGTDLGACLANLRQHAATQGASASILSVSNSLPHGYRHLMAMARPQVRETLSSAFRKSLEQLDSEAAVVALGCHLTLYDGRTQVFINAVSASQVSLGEKRPDRVVLLIDDIYDMLDVLSVDGGLYDKAALRENTVQNLASHNTSEHSEQSSRDLALAALDSEVNELNFLLSWRRSEMVAAEALAHELGVPLYLLGVKHPLETAVLAVSKSMPPATYISHPISRHRRDLAATGSWSEDVFSVNRLPMEMARRGILTVMPTAIDELRFSRASTQDLYSRQSGTSPRWPTMASDFGLISPRYTPEQTAHVGIPAESRAFEHDSEAASIFIRTVESSVYSEIPFRDHYIVNHCPNLLAFRPREGGNRFSGGVTAEINFFARLAKREPRRMVVVHDSADIPLIIRRILDGDELISPDLGVKKATEYVLDAAMPKLFEELTEGQAGHFVRTGKRTGSQLDQTRVSEKVWHEVHSDAWTAATVATLLSEFTGLGENYTLGSLVVGDTTRTQVFEQSARMLTSPEREPSHLLNELESVLRALWTQDYEQELDALVASMKTVLLHSATQ